MAGLASLAQVAGRRFAGPPILFYLIVDLLAVNECQQARALDSRNMDKNSCPPPSGWMKLKPLVALNHFTVQVAI
ncbi:hypothetical protein ABID19_005803 [Mesorhizobium robiniae]|uniref:Secreted protein n=1 Tax=Mesorhizobium robiniae TaxID=559315 RepID=A0ABV2GWR4_9HYPH